MSVATNLLAANVSGIETDATGWTAGTNTTRSQNTTRFAAGSKSLQLTATAAGSVSAVTAARVAVTAGTPIMTYAYFSNVVAASGRTPTVTVSWYSTVTGGTPLSTSVVTGTALANSTTWQTPPPQGIFTVPAGSTYASVTVSVSGLTAGAGVVVDEIAIGPPALIDGNLLSYSDQSAEVGVTGWQSLWQSTVSRSSTSSFEGWYSLSMTSTATGAMRAGMVGTVPVTEGTEYMPRTWVYAPRSGAEFHMTARWYDVGGTQLSISSQTWTITTASTWQRCPVIDVAPVGAVTARMVVEPVAVAIGETWLFDQMTFAPAPALTGNLIGYNAQGIEASADAWVATSGCIIARSIVRSWEGAASLAITATGGDATVSLATPVAVTPREAYKAVPTIYSAGFTVAPQVDIIFSWLNDAGATLSSTFVRWTVGTAAGWYVPTGSAVAPTGATSVTVSFKLLSATSGSVFYLDNVLIASGGLGIIADPIPGAYAARISLQGLTTGGYTTWGLWRMLSDGSITPVRGPDADMTQLPIIGDVDVIEDYESPLGVPVQYMVKLWTTPTVYTSASSITITLDEPPDTEVVIKDPTLPARWTTATVETVPDWTRPARQGINQVRGRARPIVISDIRSSRTGQLTLVTQSEEERDQIWWVLDTGNALLIQWPSTWHEADMYVSVGDVVEAHASPVALYADREWTTPLTEVDRPVGGIVGSADRTWQDVLDESPDWLAVLNSYDSWLDVLTGVRGS